MDSEFSIQMGALADVAQIVKLMEQYWSFENIAGFQAERITPLLEYVLSHPQRGTIWIARAGGELVGYLIVVFVFSFEYQGLGAEIDELFVLPHARSRGIGTALLEVAENSLAERGCTCVQLQLGTANRAAHAFYCRRGYAARTAYELLAKQLQDA